MIRISWQAAVVIIVLVVIALVLVTAPLWRLV